MKRILVAINAKPRTCGECRWLRMDYRKARDGSGYFEQRTSAWCDVFRRWLETNRHHKYRCDECLRAEREAE